MNTRALNIRVVIADDQEVARIGTRTVLTQCPDIDVIAEAKSGGEALQCIAERKPDVLIAEIRLPDLTVMKLAEQLADTSVQVLIYSAYEEGWCARQFVENELAGYLLKHDASERLVEAVRGIARGEEGWFSPRIAQQIIVLKQEGGTDEILQRYNVTPREREVLNLVAQGLSNQQIANTLHIAKNTVRSHISHIYGKLNAHARREVMAWAWEHGLVEMK